MTGKVYLVGAGPGDPGLITVKGMQALEQAQVVVYDRLVDPVLLDAVPESAERIFVGKARGRQQLTQPEINQLLVDKAAAGLTVVRLKGGDPFVFGRGGEEALELKANGLPFEVVPGVTSAIAGPAYAGIPLTHRGIATTFTVVSGSEDPSKPGALGPAIKGSSKALITARILSASYPKGYKPKRTTKLMVALPHLKGSIDDLAAFLK